MAPGSAHREVRKAGPRRQAENRCRKSPPSPIRLSVLLLFDVLDHLGHVVLVLAKLGGILEEFLVLLFGFLQRNRFLLLGGIGLFGFELGIELVGAGRLEFLLDWRRGARAPRLQKGFRIKRSAAFRANHRIAQQIVVAGPATRTNPLGAPFGFGHHSLLERFSKSRRRAIATGTLPCQKQTSESRSIGAAPSGAPAYGPKTA